MVVWLPASPVAVPSKGGEALSVAAAEDVRTLLVPASGLRAGRSQLGACEEIGDEEPS